MPYQHIENRRTYKRRSSVPFWYKDDTKRCSCQITRARVLEQASGYSDSVFYLVECPSCNHQWCIWIEG